MVALDLLHDFSPFMCVKWSIINPFAPWSCFQSLSIRFLFDNPSHSSNAVHCYAYILAIWYFVTNSSLTLPFYFLQNCSVHIVLNQPLWIFLAWSSIQMYHTLKRYSCLFTPCSCMCWFPGIHPANLWSFHNWVFFYGDDSAFRPTLIMEEQNFL